jgi:hypothetical protein
MHHYHVAGLTGGRTAVVTTGPCCAPHQTISDVGLIGGGQVPLPGEGSLGHHRRLGLRAFAACPWCALTGLWPPREEAMTPAQGPEPPPSSGVGGGETTPSPAVGRAFSRATPGGGPWRRSGRWF